MTLYLNSFCHIKVFSLVFLHIPYYSFLCQVSLERSLRTVVAQTNKLVRFFFVPLFVVRRQRAPINF